MCIRDSIYSEESLLPNFVVADLSFISLKLVFQPINNLLSGDLIEGIFLIKPQFEVGKDRVSKGGVVRKAEYHIEAIESVINTAEQLQWNIQGLVASPLVGPAGNHEYLAWMSKIGMSNPIIDINFIENLVQETL